MAESVPNVEAATANLLTTLAAVSTATGSEFTVSQVAYWTPFGLHPDYAQTVVTDNGVLLEEDDIEPIDDQPIFEVFDYWQNYALTVFAMEPEDSGYRARRRLQRMRAALTRAIKADINRGGTAHDTLVTDWTFAASEGGIPALVLRFKCRIRESALDPAIQR